MKVELVDLEEFSGNKAHIYSVLLDDAEDTLFDQLINERIKEKDLKLNEDGIISGELIINDYEEN